MPKEDINAKKTQIEEKRVTWKGDLGVFPLSSKIPRDCGSGGQQSREKVEKVDIFFVLGFKYFISKLSSMLGLL